MDYKRSANNLINLLKKYSLNAEEKDAVKTAIGVLAWAALSESRIKGLKAKRTKTIK